MDGHSKREGLEIFHMNLKMLLLDFLKFTYY